MMRRQRGPIFGDIITPARKHARLAGPDCRRDACDPGPSCYLHSECCRGDSLKMRRVLSLPRYACLAARALIEAGWPAAPPS